MNKAREQLIKFGMEQEYLDWKTNLPVSIEKLKVGTKFKVIKGPYEGREGTIIGKSSDGYESDIKGSVTNVFVHERTLDYIKLIK